MRIRSFWRIRPCCAYGCKHLDIAPCEVEYIDYAEQFGVGSAEIGTNDVVMLRDPFDASAFSRTAGLCSGG